MNPFTCSSNSKCWSGKIIRYGSELSRAGPCSSLPPLVVPPPQTVDHEGAYTPGAMYHSSGSGDCTKRVCLSLVGHTLRRTLSIIRQVLVRHCPPLGRSPSCNRLGEHPRLLQQGKKGPGKLKNRTLVLSISVFLSQIFFPTWRYFPSSVIPLSC